jgi:hypothetical protein
MEENGDEEKRVMVKNDTKKRVCCLRRIIQDLI